MFNSTYFRSPRWAWLVRACLCAQFILLPGGATKSVAAISFLGQHSFDEDAVCFDLVAQSAGGFGIEPANHLVRRARFATLSVFRRPASAQRRFVVPQTARHATVAGRPHTFDVLLFDVGRWAGQIFRHGRSHVVDLEIREIPIKQVLTLRFQLDSALAIHDKPRRNGRPPAAIPEWLRRSILPQSLDWREKTFSFFVVRGHVMYRSSWTHLDSTIDRLANSRNPLERRSIYLGRGRDHGDAVLFDTELLFEHMHLLGPTGTGKTTLGLQNIVTQLIRRNDGPVVILDCKGDSDLFQTVLAEADLAGRTFKWFTNMPSRSTYVFNPLEQKLVRRLSLSELVGLVIHSLNLHHGEDYGRAWFAIMAWILTKRGFEETMLRPENVTNAQHSHQQRRLFPREPPVESFHDLHRIVHRVIQDTDEFQAAQHLSFIMESLVEFEQLNLSPRLAPNHPALVQAIHMPDVITEGHVVYFFLQGVVDAASVAQIARLAFYSLLMSAVTHQREHGVTPRIYCICDEAQIMMAKSIDNVLTQARSYGMACILSHQTLSQLNPPGGVDLRELFLSCTAAKLVFAARDPWLQDYIVKTSGLTKYFSTSYEISSEGLLAGQIGPEYALVNGAGDCPVRITEYTGPRLNAQDIANASYDPNVCLAWIARRHGLSASQGWFPVTMTWPISYEEHLRRIALPWPAPNEATIKITSDWPESTEDTVTVTTQPELRFEEQDAEVCRRLEALGRELERK